MSFGQSTGKPDISFAKDMRGKILSWTGAAGSALRLQCRRLLLGMKKHAWVIFAILLTAGVVEFNYYQARLTRDYLHALLVNAARTSGDMDALDAKLNQLTTKIDALSTKLDNLSAKPDKPPPAPQTSSAPQTKPKHSIFSKPW